MSTYHIELRHFPRALTRFNLSGAQLGPITLLWVQDKIVEFEGEKWAPYESTIIILEGPPIPLGGLSMGRGWRTAQHEGTDVTERVLDEARRALADGSAYGGTAEATEAAGANGAAVDAEPPARSADTARDYPSASAQVSSPGDQTAGAETVGEDQLALGVQLAGLLGDDPVRLLAAWRAVAARASGLAPSESLALAERERERERRPPD